MHKQNSMLSLEKSSPSRSARNAGRREHAPDGVIVPLFQHAEGRAGSIDLSVVPHTDNLQIDPSPLGSFPLSPVQERLYNSADLNTGLPEKALGITYRIAVPPPEVVNDLQLPDRWILQDKARHIVPDHRVAHCLVSRIAASKDVQVVSRVIQHTGEVQVGYSGLQTCGSVWDCPICSRKISDFRRSEMIEALKRARARGLHVYFFSFTVRHSSSEGVDLINEAIASAMHHLVNRKVWRKFSDRIGLKGWVRAREVTTGDSGWHVHFHQLIFTEQEMDKIDEYRLIQAWVNAVATVEDRLNLPVGTILPIGEIGLRIQQGDDAATYISKWGLADELTSDGKGGMNRNVTPWGLLRKAVQGDYTAANKFRAYSSAMKGRHQLQWSKGLREFLGMEGCKTDEEIAAEEVAPGEVLARIEPPAWSKVVSSGNRGELLRKFRQGIEEGKKFLSWLACQEAHN